jgi:ribose transport system ATP-binding protein
MLTVFRMKRNRLAPGPHGLSRDRLTARGVESDAAVSDVDHREEPEPISRRPTAAPRLEVRGLSKTFAGVTVLDDAHLKIAPGEVHALVGQNGSGKSTLVKLLSGVYRADPGGDILVDGIRIGTPVNAGRLHAEGLAFVHQDLGLIHDLSVTENVRVGQSAVNPFTRRIQRRADDLAVRESLEFLGVNLDPGARVAGLQPSERVAVAVARALQERSPSSGVIVFDESSRPLPHEVLPDFYAMIRLLASQGTAVLMVSHDMREVLQIADRVTALRNGRVVETGRPTDELDEAALTRLVLGRDGDPGDYVATRPCKRRDGVVALHGIRGGGLEDVTAEVRQGEVVGFTGAIDSGLSSLAKVLAGAGRGGGELVVGGRRLDLARQRPGALIAAGVAYIPRDRHEDGLATDLTVEENVTLPHLRTKGRPFWSGVRWRHDETRAVLEDFDVRPRVANAVVATLSGGNQQKVLMGKWLRATPTLLVLDDPTQAVDVGARATVLRATRQAAVDGAAVALCSSEVDDLAAVCDRVLVLSAGRITSELSRPFSSDDILAATFGVTDGSLDDRSS